MRWSCSAAMSAVSCAADRAEADAARLADGRCRGGRLLGAGQVSDPSRLGLPVGASRGAAECLLTEVTDDGQRGTAVGQVLRATGGQVGAHPGHGALFLVDLGRGVPKLPIGSRLLGGGLLGGGLCVGERRGPLLEEGLGGLLGRSCQARLGPQVAQPAGGRGIRTLDLRQRAGGGGHRGLGRVDLALRGEDRISAGGGDREADREADREGTDRTARHAGSPRAQRAHSHGGIQHVRPLVAGVDSRSAGREYGANSPQFTCVTENANRHMAFQKSHDCLFEMTPMCLSRWAPNHTDVRTQSHGLVTK